VTISRIPVCAVTEFTAGFFGFGATLQNGAPWGAPVFLYGLIYFSMAFLNVG